MTGNSDFVDVKAASERLFRSYKRHCVTADRDTLFSLLEASHSLNDRLKRGADLDFFDFREFSALKCVRNYFHHHQEVWHVVRVVPLGGYPVDTDLITMCLLSREIVDAAIESEPTRYRELVRHACGEKFHWYESAVNINPCVFNFVVLAYERLKEAEIDMSGEGVEEFEDSYRFEEENGHSHFVDGRLWSHAGSLRQLLADINATKGL